jgi:hypothetical protein
MQTISICIYYIQKKSVLASLVFRTKDTFYCGGNIVKQNQKVGDNMVVSEWRKPHNLTFGALLTALAVCFQLAPLFFALVGLSLSALSTLPIALAASINPLTGLCCYLTSFVLLSLFGISRALLFLFSTGLLGLVLGLLISKRAPLPVVVVVPALSLCLGMVVVSEILGFPLFPMLTGVGRTFIGPIILIYNLIYTAIWVPILASLLVRIERYWRV